MARPPAKPQPQPEPEPEPPAPEPDPPAPSAPPPAKTIADEQRERSDEIARMGVEAYKEQHDERSEEERQPRQVPGVASPVVAKGGGSWSGSTRSTPEARAAQNPAAPR